MRHVPVDEEVGPDPGPVEEPVARWQVDLEVLHPEEDGLPVVKVDVLYRPPVRCRVP